MNTSKHLIAAISEWQARNCTAALPKRLIATADVIQDLQRQNAIPEFLAVVYCEGDKRLNVE